MFLEYTEEFPLKFSKLYWCPDYLISTNSVKSSELFFFTVYGGESSINRNLCSESRRSLQGLSTFCARQLGISHGYMCTQVCATYSSSVGMSMNERDVHLNFVQHIITEFLTNCSSLKLFFKTGWNLKKLLKGAGLSKQSLDMPMFLDL